MCEERAHMNLIQWRKGQLKEEATAVPCGAVIAVVLGISFQPYPFRRISAIVLYMIYPHCSAAECPRACRARAVASS